MPNSRNQRTEKLNHMGKDYCRQFQRIQHKPQLCLTAGTNGFHNLMFNGIVIFPE